MWTLVLKTLAGLTKNFKGLICRGKDQREKYEQKAI